MMEIVDKQHIQCAQQLRALLATYQDAEDLINIGAYAHGSNPNIDRAIAVIDQIKNFLQQSVNDNTPIAETIERLKMLVA
jgi:flagellum-specific ATP synthase